MAWVLIAVGAVRGQGVEELEADLTDRPVSEIRIVGLKRVSEQLVRNQLRMSIGNPYDPDVVKGDVELLYRLGDFKIVTASAELLRDGSVLVIYDVQEAAIVAEIQVVGNKVISDQELLGVVRIVRGAPIDDFLIEKAKRAMENLYQERGHYLTSVTVDQSELDESGILFFRVIEGPRVKVKAVEFEGNKAFPDSKLKSQIKTRTAILFFRRGELDEDQLADDVAAIATYYSERGYLDVRVDRIIELSPENTEVKVTFLIDEGDRFTLRSVQTEPDPLRVFSLEQIKSMLRIKPGDVYSRQKILASRRVIHDAYGLMGYLDVAVNATELRSGAMPEVDLLLEITEGRQYKVGLVQITGNFLTQDRVIRRELRGLQPGRPFDARQIQRSITRIRQTRLFSDVNITVQDPDPDNPEYRNVLVEVKEDNTGSVNFGIAAGTDTGFFGEFSLVQRNFDIADLPESPGELFSGRAFRGAGQRFSMTFRPGNELFQYIVSFTEPNLLDADVSLSVSAAWTDREYQSNGRRIYDEQRISLVTSLGRKLGDVWDVALNLQINRIRLDDIASNAPVDVFAAKGPNNVTALGLSLVRSTITEIRRPGSGTRLEARVDQFGALFGDFTFTRLSADYTVFLTVTRDFLDRRSTLKLTSRVGGIIGNAPLYEKYYLGGRTFRGFEFRTISPKGIDRNGTQTSDPVGGTWLFFFGAQYEIPLFTEMLSGVLFVDSGTVSDDPIFNDYRVSIGAGLRIYIQQFGPVPIAIDFAFPLVKENLDETQVFSFSAELPF